MAPSHVSVHEWFELKKGLRLAIVANEHGDPIRIGRIQFAKAAGWDHAKAEAWLHELRPARDLGRTVFLQTPHRFSASLANTLVTLVCAHDWLATCPPGASEPMFEFCAVPTCNQQDWPKNGAGL